MSVRKVAGLYNISRSTLQDIIHGRSLEKNHRKGPVPYLTVEGEENICEWIANAAACGFPVKVYRFQETVEKLLMILERKLHLTHSWKNIMQIILNLTS